MDELKCRLLDTNELIDNEYLDLYINLIQENKFTVKQRYSTQRHHIIPVCFYKEHKLPINNDSSNLVNLLFKDHILAHCYLVLASKETIFKYHNMVAIYKIIHHRDFSNDEEYYNLDLYQKAYEQSREICYKYNPMFLPESRAYHDNIMKSESVRKKISDSMKEYRKKHPFTDEHRKKISCKAKGNKRIEGRKRIYNSDGEIKYVEIDDLSDWLNKGWALSKDRKQIGVESRHYTRHVDLDELHKKLSDSHKGQSPGNKGIPLSKERKKQLSELYQGTKWVNNGIIQTRIHSEDIDKYISNGYILGKLPKQRK